MAMPPPSWAFQVENFSTPPHEELICSICQCVFCDPVECPCRHVFCSLCISKWIGLHRSCPICRKRTSTVALQPVNRIIKNLIYDLTLNCINAPVGCDITMTLETVNGHIKVCEYELEECPNLCGKAVFRKDLTHHNEQDCPFRRVTCETCGLSIEPPTATDHNCVKALHEIVKDKDEKIKALEEKVEKLQNAIEEKDKKARGQNMNSEFDIDALSSCSSSDMFPLSQRSDDSPVSSTYSSNASLFNDSNGAAAAADNTNNTEQVQNEDRDFQSSYGNEASVQYLGQSGGNASAGGSYSTPGTSSDISHSLRKRMRLNAATLPSVESPSCYWMSWVTGHASDSDLNAPSDGTAPIPGVSRVVQSQMGANVSERAESGPSSAETSINVTRSLNTIDPADDHVFEHAVSLLIDCPTSESDPEWLPGNDSDTESSPTPPMAWESSNSDDSTSRNSLDDPTTDPWVDEASASSYEVQVPTTTHELLEKYCDDSGSDPDYAPGSP